MAGKEKLSGAPRTREDAIALVRALEGNGTVPAGTLDLLTGTGAPRATADTGGAGPDIATPVTDADTVDGLRDEVVKRLVLPR